MLGHNSSWEDVLLELFNYTQLELICNYHLLWSFFSLRALFFIEVFLLFSLYAPISFVLLFMLGILVVIGLSLLWWSSSLLCALMKSWFSLLAHLLQGCLHILEGCFLHILTKLLQYLLELVYLLWVPCFWLVVYYPSLSSTYVDSSIALLSAAFSPFSCRFLGWSFGSIQSPHSVKISTWFQSRCEPFPT